MLTLTNLHAGYGKVEVLHGISLEVPKGQVVTLIGSNGAGKTTTMRAVSGMISPTQGSVTLGGKNVTGLEPYRVAKLGLAHQGFDCGPVRAPLLGLADDVAKELLTVLDEALAAPFAKS